MTPVRPIRAGSVLLPIDPTAHDVADLMRRLSPLCGPAPIELIDTETAEHTLRTVQLTGQFASLLVIEQLRRSLTAGSTAYFGAGAVDPIARKHLVRLGTRHDRRMIALIPQLYPDIDDLFVEGFDRVLLCTNSSITEVFDGDGIDHQVIDTRSSTSPDIDIALP